MNNEQFENFKAETKEHIEDVIQSKVNGKIDGLSKRLDAFIARADPAVKVFENFTWFKKALVGGVITVGAIFGALDYITRFFHKR